MLNLELVLHGSDFSLRGEKMCPTEIKATKFNVNNLIDVNEYVRDGQIAQKSPVSSLPRKEFL